MATKKNRQQSLPNLDGHVFTVGSGAHTGFNGDCYPYTVIAVSDSGREVYVSHDEYKVIDNLGGYVEGKRECEFTTVLRPLAECEVYKLRKSGHYHSGKFGGKSRGYAWSLQPGRRYSRNPHF